ncbi:hypothetical protein NLG97_g8098 [Lecanicillium saksenae]|uniref:Uncharacterized protein n=1 Tax=Lecanicillium saksenae TaxID=468837 RepID=A0ACC1QJV6_9HYPO|nr:hypothetical protein NLG97_g8098 [Lecanicillium saksenae]
MGRQQGKMKSFTKSFSWKMPIIKVNSIPVARDDNDDDDDQKDQERTPLAQGPPQSLAPSASKASSITVVEKDVYNVEPIVHTHGWKPETMRSPVLVSLALASTQILPQSGSDSRKSDRKAVHLRGKLPGQTISEL